ncbi:MAG TPA: Rieske (2Fe-2S) protein [Thermoplasmata archaeon]|nr:Rieske (2Fe-2S) protein [Thermoplasmata archaeon]
MTFHQAIKLSEFPETGVAKATVGGKEYVLIRIGSSYFAMDGLCSHSEGELGDGAMTGDWLVCPIHEGRFDPRTGKANPEDDWVSDLKSYLTKVEQEFVWIDL